MSDIPSDKSSARRIYRSLRRALTAEERRALDELIYLRLREFLSHGAFDSLYTYVSLPDEVDTTRLISCLLTESGIRVAVPRVEGNVIAFYEPASPEDLTEGYMHIPEPREGCPAASLPGAHSLIIVPGLAFTSDGRRLGYGGGYFDRFLAGCPGAVKLGLCYSCQLAAALPTDAHDIRMDYILTDNLLIKI